MNETGTRSLVKKILPHVVQNWLAKCLARRRDMLFFRQKSALIGIGRFQLDLPERHPLREMLSNQPLRDKNIGVIAAAVSRKYPTATMIDVGANIGDTGAIIASNCENRLLLVEGSRFYFGYLELNAPKLGPQIEIFNVLVGDGGAIEGELRHWGGTAYIDTTSTGRPSSSVRLETLAGGAEVGFVKIDTDGFDEQIISSHLGFFAKERPLLIFESMISNLAELVRVNELYGDLVRIGYRNFVFWDDPGLYVTATNSLEVVSDLNRYLYLNTIVPQAHRALSNFDVLCVHDDDLDVLDEIKAFYANLKNFEFKAG